MRIFKFVDRHFCIFILIQFFFIYLLSTCCDANIINKLQADGKYIKTTSGSRMLLKGFNIETHTWAYDYNNDICDYNASTGRWNVRDEPKFVDELQNMIPWLLPTEDIENIKQLGANMIRLQLPHYLFESINSPGDYYDWGFDQLNNWITAAASYGLYIIIDLHVPYGGRQYSCDESQSCKEGKTLWMNENEKNYTKNLWREIILRTKQHANIIYQLMNEPYPLNAGYDNSAWWLLAQQLINVIRTAGSDHLIIVSQPLPNNTPFKKLNDSINNLAYDFHFYEPFKFTHQQAFWLDPQPPSATYPYSENIEYIGHSYDKNERDYTNSEDWIRWEENFSQEDGYSPYCKTSGIANATHVRPTFGVWSSTNPISFDDVEFRIDNMTYNLTNADFESGSDSFPDYWTQYDNINDSLKAQWAEEADGNKYVIIPATTEQDKVRVIMPAESELIPLPTSYNKITVASKVRGDYTLHNGRDGANLYGLDWFGPCLYNKSNMEEDIKQFSEFREGNNVPVMCLEFGVIMEAEESEGHLLWLKDYTDLLAYYDIHGAYHVYRGLNNQHKSFGIYQCTGKPAVQCDNKYLFVIPTITKWFKHVSFIPSIINLLLFD